MTKIISHKYNFVYKTTNNLNGDYYYGVHSTNNLDDGYLGSGKRLNYAINKYGKSNFTREIVQYFSNIKNAYILEAAIVTPELVNDPHCYNIALGGRGRFKEYGLTEEGRKHIIESNRNRIVTQETREKQRKSMLGKNKGRILKNTENMCKPKVNTKNMCGPKSPKHCENIGKVNKDTRYMNNGVINKRVKIYDIDKYLENGWIIGYLSKK